MANAAATESFDLIVVGAGPAGYVGAIRAAQLGFKVACIEKEKALGGTCLRVGCIPSKALLDSSEHYMMAKSKLSKHGVMVGDLKLDLDTMIKRKDGVVRQLTTGVAGLFKKHKIEHVLGHGKLAGREGENNIVDVGGRKLSAPRVLIATGSEANALPFLPFDEQRVVSSTGALSLPEVPKHLVVIGGGVIGLELGSVWLRLGAKVTVVEYMDRILPGMDRQAATDLHKSLMKQGMEFKLAAKCLGAKKDGNWMVVEAEELNGGAKFKLECDYILVATGRKPYTTDLGLETVGVTKDERGRIQINEHYETNAPGVFAVGDCIPGVMLAHKAEEEAIAAVELMAGQAGHVNYDVIPNVVYTHPELASVGATEDELKNQNIEYKSGTFPFIANGRAKAMDEVEGFVKVLADAKSDRILGVHILGPRASDLIAEAAGIMEFGGSAEDLARTCHAHPTLPEAVKEAALAVDKRQIHI
jgi:dihydrolipoamide dehydrogenase